MTKRWDEVIVEVQDLVRKGKPLAKIMGEMEARGFKASKRSYREKIKEWGLKRNKGNREQRIARRNLDLTVPEAPTSRDSATANCTSFALWLDTIKRADPLEFTKLLQKSQLDTSTMIEAPFGDQILDTHLRWDSRASLLQLLIAFGSVDLLIAFHQFNSMIGLDCPCLCGCKRHQKPTQILISLSHFATICCKPEILSKIHDLLDDIDCPHLDPSCLSLQNGLYHSMIAQSSEASVSMTRLLLNFGQRLDLSEPTSHNVFKYAHLKAGPVQQRRLRKIKIYIGSCAAELSTQAISFLADLNSNSCKNGGMNRLEQEIFYLILKNRDWTALGSGTSQLCTDNHNNLFHWILHHTPPGSYLTEPFIEWCTTGNEEQLSFILLQLLMPCSKSKYHVSNMVIPLCDSSSSKTDFGPIGNLLLHILDTILKRPAMVIPFERLIHSVRIERKFDGRIALEIARLILGSLTESDARWVTHPYESHRRITTDWENYQNNYHFLKYEPQGLFALAAMGLSTSRFLDAELKKDNSAIQMERVLGAMKARTENKLSRYELPPKYEDLMVIHFETSQQSVQQRNVTIERMASLIMSMAIRRPHASADRYDIQVLLQSERRKFSEPAIKSLESALEYMERTQSRDAVTYSLPIPQSM